MADIEVVKRVKIDLKNFNSRVSMLKKCELELNKILIEDNPSVERLNLLKFKIQRIKLNIKIMRISLSILRPRELKIITDHYFANISTRNIAIKLNLSIGAIDEVKKKAIEKLASFIYKDVNEFPFILTHREIPGEFVKKQTAAKPVYQYDMKNNLIKKWDSTNQCSKSGFSYDSVKRCCIDECKQYKGYKWSYRLLNIN